MTSPAPVVTILMPVYNAAPYLRAAIDSILSQTWTDYRLVCMDDGSGDDSLAIARSFSDPRVEVIAHTDNRGYVYRLNQGLAEVRSPYVARMDADDIAHPGRLAAQVAFLEAHPNVGIVGTAIQPIGPAGEPVGNVYRPSQKDREIRWQLLTAPPFMHPTVMMRSSVLQEHGLRYDETLMPAEDYDLWRRLLNVTQGANLPEALVSYRRHQAQISQQKHETQKNRHLEVAMKCVHDLLPGFSLSVEELVSILRFLQTKPDWAGNVQENNRAALLYVDMYRQFARIHGSLNANRLVDPVFRRAARRLAQAPRQPGWMVTEIRLAARFAGFLLSSDQTGDVPEGTA